MGSNRKNKTNSSAKGLLKRLAILSIVTVSTLTAICVFRALVYYPTPSPAVTCDDDQRDGHQKIGLEHGILDRFRESIRYQTITKGPYSYDAQELLRFIAFIEKSELYAVCLYS